MGVQAYSLGEGPNPGSSASTAALAVKS